jgi:hypothetical protein
MRPPSDPQTMSNVSPQERQDDADRLIARVDLLLAGHDEHDPAEELRTIADYYEHLSRGVGHKPWAIDLDPRLFQQFEAMSIFLRDRLSLYPETIGDQVREILRSARLPELFGTLGTLSRDELQRKRRATAFGPVGRLLSVLKRYLFVPSLADLDVRPRRLTAAKIALHRLAQVVQYASSVGLLDYDLDADDLREHYDPTLVERSKILILINLLKIEVGTISDSNVRDLLSKRVDQLETEVRRPKPRWGRIIAGFFLLWSFTADLKTNAPGVYDRVLSTIHTILTVIHEDGSVQRSKKSVPLPSSHEQDHVALLPERPRPEEEIAEESED